MSTDRSSGSLESKKRRLMELVDLSAEPLRKAAFYSNEEAMAILTQLYQRWEHQRRRGTPLDCATEEELDRLLLIAERIEPEDLSAQQSRMLAVALYGEEVLEELRQRERKEKKLSEKLKRVLKNIFFLKPW